MTFYDHEKSRENIINGDVAGDGTASIGISFTNENKRKPLNKSLSANEVEELSNKLPGSVFTKGSSDYEKSRLTWNGTIEQHPSIIVQARSAGDIKAAVDFAIKYNLGISVKATGHGALVPANKNTLLIDTSRMKGILVNSEEKTATFEPGVVAIEFLRATQKYGLAGPTADSPGVGMTGYTLSGGYGDLPRVFGLGSDNLLSAQVILMDGRYVTVSENENPDIFWAIRGGGGNFAIVTSMTVSLHSVNEVLSGVLTFDINDAHKVISRINVWNKKIPDNMTMSLSFFSKNVAKTASPIITVSLLYFGPASEGDLIVGDLIDGLHPKNNTIKPQTYLSYFENDVEDPGYGFKNYWHGVLIDELTPSVVDILVQTVSEDDSIMMLLFSYYRGGVWSRLPESKTAVSHRNASWLLNGRAFFKGDNNVVSVARKQVATLADKLSPYNKGVPFTYVEYEGQCRLIDVYGEGKLNALKKIKRNYDPDNRLRFNANIPPLI